MPRAKVVKLREDQLSNDAAHDIEFQEPYRAEIAIRGDANILFHAWSIEAVEEKANAAKGSRAKKIDNVESYVYRDERKQICVPGEYLRASICNAAKYIQDPR